MSDKSLNKLEILDYCRYDYLPPKVAVAVSFGVDPTKIEECISKVEKVLSFVGNKTLLDKPIVISTSIDELIDEINSRLLNMQFIGGHKQKQASIIDNSLKNDDEKPITTEVNSQEYHALYDVFFAKCRNFRKQYNQRVNLLENAITHGKILLNKLEVELIDFIRWCEQKNLSFPQELKELVKEYTLSYVDLEARCAKYELRIKELEAKDADVEEQLKPLHGSERNGWVKLMAGIIATNYDNLLNKNDIKDWVDTIYVNLETAENDIEINVSQITLDKDTLNTKLKLVKTYCKKHPKK